MHFDCIEIGTSDFDTLAEQYKDTTRNILSVEPLEFYLNSLPKRKGQYTLNAAVSDKRGELEFFYIKQEDINRLNLPRWAKGCSRLGSPHPIIDKEWPGLQISKKVPVVTFNDVITEFKVTSIGLLKIDTEGHDCIILNDAIKYWIENPKCFPKFILFESNEHTSPKDVEEVKNKLIDLNYVVMQCGWPDTFLGRKDCFIL